MLLESYPPTLVVIGTDQDVGKTVTSMGIISKILSPEFGYQPQEIGYMKPVGQHSEWVKCPDNDLVRADRDVLLVAQLCQPRRQDYRAMSPIVWKPGSTAAFIDAAVRGDPAAEREKLKQRIWDGYRAVAEGARVVVCEGTGQPGVGSVGGISNADVILLLREKGVPVFTALVVRGGIGSTIDRVFPYLVGLVAMGCPVNGLIVNAIRRDKIDQVRSYLERYYAHVFPKFYGHLPALRYPPPILGLVPEIPELKFPTMRLLAETFSTADIDHVGFLNPPTPVEYASLFVRGVKVRSLEAGFEPYITDGDVVITGINANDSILRLLADDSRRKREGVPGLSGLILSCAEAGGLKAEALEGILVSQLPTLILRQDSASIVRRLSDMSVKIQPYDVAKKALIDREYRQNLDFGWLSDELRAERRTGYRGESAPVTISPR